MRSLAPLLRGEGWGEGLSPRIRWQPDSRRIPPHRNPRFARIPASPRKRGEAKSNAPFPLLLPFCFCFASSGQPLSLAHDCAPDS
ncbi:hypothetical protein EAS61_06565 [Bradyrhizobium zhanjiangense]|uniref:Uncharacterized protein n=1 Tax=Bradyrhizobium zhanjiangense TaxID=1325107 RepID=A0A4Q0QUS7_9BRAD|nr:hypothetical protein EAS61_06565 [Bradyrhizobium zhanjiangense]